MHKNEFIRNTMNAKENNMIPAMNVTRQYASIKEDIDKAVKDAEAHAEEDKKRKEVVDNHNKLDGLIFTIEKSMKDLVQNPSTNNISNNEYYDACVNYEKLTEAFYVKANEKKMSYNFFLDTLRIRNMSDK